RQLARSIEQNGARSRIQTAGHLQGVEKGRMRLRGPRPAKPQVAFPSYPEYLHAHVRIVWSNRYERHFPTPRAGFPAYSHCAAFRRLRDFADTSDAAKEFSFAASMTAALEMIHGGIMHTAPRLGWNRLLHIILLLGLGWVGSARVHAQLPVRPSPYAPVPA